MRRGRAALMITIGTIGMIVALLLLNHEHEPVYAEKTVSSWLADFDRWDGSDTNKPMVVAVRRLGTNALPIIVRMSLWQDSKLKAYLGVEWEKYPRLLKYRWTIAPMRWLRARAALGIMGVSAEPAVPIYIHALGGEDGMARRLAACALGSIGTNAAASIPSLIDKRSDQDDIARGNIMGALGDISQRPDLCVPVLTNALCDTSSYVRGRAAYGLGKFGREAASAAPLIAKLLDDSGLGRNYLIGLNGMGSHTKYSRAAAAAALEYIQSGLTNEPPEGGDTQIELPSESTR